MTKIYTQNDIDLAWAAGFFDGEGCIHLRKRRPTTKYNGVNNNKYYHSLMVSANQISKQPLNKLQKVFGGVIHKTKPIGNRRPSYGWVLHSRAARDALTKMLPYFQYKQNEAEAALSLKFSKGSRLTEQDWIERETVEQFLRDRHNTYIWEEGD